MNQCAIQQNSFGRRAREEVRSSFAGFAPEHHLRRRGDAVVCPKPRRVGVLSGAVDSPASSRCWQLRHQAEGSDSKEGSELLDIILAKGGCGFGTSNTNMTKMPSSSPPFFSGSPPSRVSNPLIQDTRFTEEKVLPPAIHLPVSRAGSPSSPTSRKGGCVRVSFGNNPSVRVEGFDCLDRDHSRNCRIPTLA